MSISNDIVVRIENSLGNTHNANQVVNFQFEVDAPQEMMRSYDKPNASSIDLRNNPDKHANDAQTKIGHITLSGFDSGGEV